MNLKIAKPASNRSQRRASPSARRESLRDSLWPDAPRVTWSRQTNDGFTTIPRLLPLVTALIKKLAARGDPSPVYWDLWARSFDEGVVTEIVEADLAFSSGYSGARAIRTWREHVLSLQELGFIRVKGEGIREIAHILLVNPLLICANLRNDRKGQVSDEWWTAFVRRANDIGAVIPDETSTRAIS